MLNSENIAADKELKRGRGQAVDLITQTSSWHWRSEIFRRSPRGSLLKLLRASFASIPPPLKGTTCVIDTLDRYEEGITELAYQLFRSPPVRAAERGGVERLLACQCNGSGTIGRSDLLFLHAFVNALAPNRVVEIGTLSGFSTASIADAVALHKPHTSDSVLVDTIDLSHFCSTDQTKPVGFEIPQLVPRLSSRIRIHSGKDARYVEQIAHVKELQLIFIDADHQHPRPTLDLIRVSTFVASGGWIILHDIALGSLGARMRAAGTPLTYGAPFGAQWLFEAWPFGKISGGNIGALRLPSNLHNLVPFVLTMLRIPSELPSIPARRTLDAFLAALVGPFGTRKDDLVERPYRDGVGPAPAHSRNW